MSLLALASTMTFIGHSGPMKRIKENMKFYSRFPIHLCLIDSPRDKDPLVSLCLFSCLKHWSMLKVKVYVLLMIGTSPIGADFVIWFRRAIEVKYFEQISSMNNVHSNTCRPT